MLYEIRTYGLVPGTIGEAEKLLGEAYDAGRKNVSNWTAVFRTDIGSLNEIIHIWAYQDIAERARLRAEAVKQPGWPPNFKEIVLTQKVELINPFPFVPDWKPGPDGPYYELRQYTFQPGALPAIQEAWKAALPHRIPFSAPAMVGSVEAGPAVNSFVHIWPYKSLDERDRIRKESAATGKWPTPRVPGRYLSQVNKILVPTSYSPAQ